MSNFAFNLKKAENDGSPMKNFQGGPFGGLAADDHIEEDPDLIQRKQERASRRGISDVDGDNAVAMISNHLGSITQTVTRIASTKVESDISPSLKLNLK